MIDLLVRRVSHLVTFDELADGSAGRELVDVDVAIDHGVIAAIGNDLDAPPDAPIVDGRGLLVLPGLINSHQHLYQGALRAIPALERAPIDTWLARLGGIVATWTAQDRFSPDAVGSIARAVLAEGLLGGVTTVADQHYVFPAGRSLPYVEATVDAAREVGVRLHACRGSLTLGPNAAMVQDVDEVLRHCVALIDSLHDPAPFAQVRVALAPCGVHADRPKLFDELAALAAAHDGVRLHTHLYEKVDAVAARERFGCTPWEFLVEHGWAGSNTWLAHVVDPPAAEIKEMAAAGVGVSHLVAPDLRMGWGPAPLRAFLDAGVTVGFGTTGSASNDGANLLGDLRVALLAHRSTDPDDPHRWPTARELLRAATRGSARCLGRADLGVIAPGCAADLVGWDLRSVDRVGLHDPVAGLLLTGLSDRADLVVAAGRVLVERGEPMGWDPDAIAADARAVVPPLPV